MLEVELERINWNLRHRLAHRLQHSLGYGLRIRLWIIWSWVGVHLVAVTRSIKLICIEISGALSSRLALAHLIESRGR